MGKDPVAQCQCDPSCKNPPLPNSPFCKKHIRYCPRRAPLSGYEPQFNPDRYNQHKGIKESHNCFAYAFDHIQMPKKLNCTDNSCPIPFPQPGRASGYPKWSKTNGKRCPDIVSRIKGDVPGSRMSTFTEKCPKGMRKIAPVVDEDQDYHFYRQDSNAYWSHKPGATDVTHLDNTKRPIYDPKLASRHNPDSGLNYNEFCGYMCIPTRKKYRFKRGGKRSMQYSKRSIKRSIKNKKRIKTRKSLRK